MTDPFYDKEHVFEQGRRLAIAFGEHVSGPDHLLEFTANYLDFRSGLPREETAWDDGATLSEEQKHATLDVARNWQMAEDTVPPGQNYDSIVILGAHRASLMPRVDHGVTLHDQLRPSLGLIALACFRPIHPKEGVDNELVSTEMDLALDLLQTRIGGSFNLFAAGAWDDLPDEPLRPDEHKHALSVVGSIGHTAVTVLSGSVPVGSERATTASTLKTLGSYLGHHDLNLLFVTTSLARPYQAIQIRNILGEQDVVGVCPASLRGMNSTEPDAQFRILLQEIGATIKNTFGN